MYIHITPEEFEDDFKELWKHGLLIHPHIDYATNAIHCYFENKDVIIFKFKNYGFINDNRFNKYEISSDTTGITIKITKSNYL
jgi:hypothetical protein